MKLSITDKLMAIAACLLWSSAFTGIKIGLAYCPPIFYAGIRFFLAGVLLTPFWLLNKNKRESVQGNMTFVFFVGLWQTFTLYYLFYQGLKLIPGSVGSIINGTAPLMVAFLASLVFPEQKLKKKNWLALFAGLGGVIFVVIGKSSNSLAVENLAEFFQGVILVFTATFVSASGNVFISRQKRKINALALNSLQFITGGVLLVIVSLCTENLRGIPTDAVFYLVSFWLIFLSATAFSIWFHLLQKGVMVSEMNIWKFIIPVSGAVLSWIIIKDDNPSLMQVAGMIIVALSIITYYKKR